MTLPAALALLVPLALSSDLPAPVDLVYRIERVEKPDPVIAVHLSCIGSQEGSTTLEVQPRWGGVDAGGEDIAQLSAFTAEGQALDVERVETHRWKVEHEAGVPLEIVYRLEPNSHQTRPSPDVHRRPVVTEEIFHAVGELFLVVPSHIEREDPGQQSIEWIGFGPEAEMACSFGVGPGPLRFEASVNRLAQSIFLAGKIQLLKREVMGQPVWLAAQGEGFRFGMEDLADLLGAIVETERAFFDDFEAPFYLVTLIPVGHADPGSLSVGGSGLTDSFTLAVSPGMPLGMDETGRQRILWLLAHEYFHEWNGRVLRRQTPAELAYWFSEGFTNYYTRRLLLRSGLIEIEEYLDSLNESLRDFYTSRVHSAPNERILEDFWNDSAVKNLPYQRGDVVAIMTDHAIRKHSGGERSLDDLVIEFMDRGREGWKISTDSFLERVAQETSEGFAQELHSILVDGDSPQLQSDVLAPCLNLELIELATFDPGFDVEASTTAGIVSGVRTDGPAHRAGLRDGQVLDGWDYQPGDARTPIGFQVEIDGQSQRINYLPSGETRIVPQFRPVPGSDPHACSEL